MTDDEYQRLAQMIQSPDSPVGIDAEKTHVMILHKLEQIEARLERLETKAAPEESSRSGEPG